MSKNGSYFRSLNPRGAGGALQTPASLIYRDPVRAWGGAGPPKSQVDPNKQNLKSEKMCIRAFSWGKIAMRKIIRY